MTDYLVLAIAHHLAVFTLVAILAMEFALLRAALTKDDLLRLGRLDMLYGIVSGIVIVVGVLRVIYGLKGYEYYIANVFFWTKIGAFMLVGLCSIPPTIAFIKWRGALAKGGAMPDAGAIAATKRWMYAEVLFLATIPMSAAALGLGLQ